MEYLILIAATIVGYPVFLLVAYVLSKMIFVKEDEFQTLEQKERLLKVKPQRHQHHHRRGLAHA